MPSQSMSLSKPPWSSAYHIVIIYYIVLTIATRSKSRKRLDYSILQHTAEMNKQKHSGCVLIHRYVSPMQEMRVQIIKTHTHTMDAWWYGIAPYRRDWLLKWSYDMNVHDVNWAEKNASTWTKSCIMNRIESTEACWTESLPPEPKNCLSIGQLHQSGPVRKIEQVWWFGDRTSENFAEKTLGTWFENDWHNYSTY